MVRLPVFPLPLGEPGAPAPETVTTHDVLDAEGLARLEARADGLHVRVDDVGPYELLDPEHADGYRPGDDVVQCTLYLSNGTDRVLDIEDITLLVRGGPYGKTGRQVRDFRGELLDDELTGTLRKGRRASVTWAYSITAGTAAELDIEVRFPYEHDRESITFSTAGVAAPAVAATRALSAALHDQEALFGEQQVEPE